MIRFVITVMLILSIISMGIGCWDVQDITDRAFITAIGLDAGEAGNSLKYKVTFEIVRPFALKARNQGISQEHEPAAIVQTIEADSINMAFEQLQARIARPLTWAHLRLVLVGEELARQSFLDIVDFFNRHPETQMRIQLLFVQDGQARDMLYIKPLLEPYASAELVAMAQVELDFSLVRSNPFFNFVEDLRRREGRGFVPRAIVSEEGNAAIKHGGAVFNNWKLAGWLSSSETRAANWITGRAAANVDGNMEGGTYTYSVDRRSISIIPHAEKGDISFNVRLKTDGTMVQRQGKHLHLSNPENIRKLEILFSQIIKNQIEEAVYKAQRDFGVDYLGFDMAMKKRMPRIYEGLDWEETFPNIPINVEVQAHITRFGLAP
ncbi:Ger(x)C family spore germination protein [Desulfitibacter alkalitolerans]|uniref:Ger(x)C family spore germination protein n=1 Tax=Desulfitibacter alkalitolerans TaxID=264641 RepID=UPI00048845FD|nr:Ger(x)C family spore germination protein [Desulfitibacter alkalitolerans]